MTEEMTKLRQMLLAKNIDYIDRSDPKTILVNYRIDRTHFFVKGAKTHFFSVVHGFGTYGGYSTHGKDKKLLEVQIDHKDPIGFQTAEDVMKMVEKYQSK